MTFGRVRAVYEPVSVRQFRQGRTETVRSSSASRSFVESMMAKSAPRGTSDFTSATYVISVVRAWDFETITPELENTKKHSPQLRYTSGTSSRCSITSREKHSRFFEG